MTDAATAKWIAEQNALQPIREFWFAKVANPKDWKAPIDGYVPAKADLDAVTDAVVHFTGTVPTFTMTRFGWKVEAIGYRAGPCGDH
jgi:hypothetical protein